MFKIAKPLFLICETPLHVGSGSDLGIVDLPIQRERHTSFPKVESSSLKGSLREAFEQTLQDKTKFQNDEDKIDFLVKIQTAFGWDEAGYTADEDEKEIQKNKDKKKAIKQIVKDTFKDKTEFAGCLGFSDARLLLFPVKSMKGVFAWITCPKVLTTFADDMALSGIVLDFKIPNEMTVPCNRLVIQDKTIVLEEYAFEVQENENCQKLAEWLANNLFSENNYWKAKIQKDIVVLKDEEFTDFVNLSTEVITRTKINNETGTVEQGALFTEEFLPAESILYSLILASPEFGKKAKSFADEKEVIECFDNSINEKIENVFQLGGNATLGKGIMRAIFLNENQPANQDNEKNPRSNENQPANQDKEEYHCPVNSQSFNSYFNRYSSFLTGGDQNAKTQ